MGKITEALANYGRENGVDIITNAEIAEINVSGNEVHSVITTDGRDFKASVVASNLSAKAMYLNLIDDKHLPDEVLREIRGYRTMSTTFKIDVAKTPTIACFPNYGLMVFWEISTIPPICIWHRILIFWNGHMMMPNMAGIPAILS